MIVMESTVTALQMRKKFGGILDRVVERGDHITIVRGNRAVATLIPVKEHEQQCGSKDRIRRIEEILAKNDEWQKKNRKKLRQARHEDSAEFIRKMRDARWSS